MLNLEISVTVLRLMSGIKPIIIKCLSLFIINCSILLVQGSFCRDHTNLETKQPKF